MALSMHATTRRLRHGLRGSAPARALRRRFRDERDRGDDAETVTEASLAQYDRLLADEADAADVPADLLRAICWYASGWRHYEPSGRVLRTPTQHGTAHGCMQLDDHWHPDAVPHAIADAAASIRYAAQLLQWLHEQVGSWERATIAFFGHDSRAEATARRVQRYRAERPWIERLPAREEPVTAAAATGSEDPTPLDETAEDDVYADLGI